MMRATSRIFLILIFVTYTKGFYLPGLAPTNFCPNETNSDCVSIVSVHANRLTSSKTVLPYDYDKFRFCALHDLEGVSENLGQVVFGERIVQTNYKIKYLQNEKCAQLCATKFTPKEKTFKNLLNAIASEYQLHFIIDNIPVIFCYSENNCVNGIPLGCHTNVNGELSFACRLLQSKATQNNGYYIFNHLSFTIFYHRVSTEKWNNFNIGSQGDRIVLVVVTPKSIKHGTVLNCDSTEPQNLDAKADNQVIYSYSVKFEEKPKVKWSSRWDYILLSNPNSSIHWFSIFNSLVIVIFLTGMMAMIFMRTLKQDISRYELMNEKDEGLEDYGWKLVHGDVFRPPRYGMLLTVLVGSGFQILCSVSFTFLFACLGFLSPANRGAFMTCMIVTYMLMGICAGYLSARLYKSFGGYKWKSNVLMTALFAPLTVFSVFFLLNLVFWAYSSSAAVPFTTILALLFLWGFISVPLTFIGSYCGYKSKAIENPVRTNQIPRQVPPQQIHNWTILNLVLGGVLPFAVIFIQMFFILNSIWSAQFYYMFGLLFVVHIMLILACIETSIILCYFSLCSENYHWWWRSFINGGSVAFFLFFYSIHYYITKTEMLGFTSMFVYYSYSFLLCWLFFITCGTVSFLGCYWFVHKIYGVIKVD